MQNDEELLQRGLLTNGKLRGQRFGDFEEFDLGNTYVETLRRAGMSFIPPDRVSFPFREYLPPRQPKRAKPDVVYTLRRGEELIPVAVRESKGSTAIPHERAERRASEQSLFEAAALSCPIAAMTNGTIWRYFDVDSSLATGELVSFPESRDFQPAVLRNLVDGDAGVVKDPQQLADSVWQIIWIATQEEPKQCLLTFVEIFIFKFLSDNLPARDLPEIYRFYELLKSESEFSAVHGTTKIEYYVSHIRPQIKRIFPDNAIAQDPNIGNVFGLATVVSKTSVINGFAFLKTSDQPLQSYNTAFSDIINAFQRFGPLTKIDPEFKLRLYEMFLKQSMRQQSLGQFFTPRNVVRPIIRMAQLCKLPAGSVLLDPAAGVGGFVLEPLLLDEALQGNSHFSKWESSAKDHRLIMRP